MKNEGKKTGKTKKIIAVAAVMAGVIIAVLIGMHLLNGDKEVEFTEVKENNIPQDIASNIIPEYKTLERALACRVDDKIYVIVTRGEKPTSGFRISVDRIMLDKEKEKSNLIVYANYYDPKKENSISQIITYPIQVVKTNLEVLPDTIELRIQY